jgi:hypothetical protein
MKMIQCATRTAQNDTIDDNSNSNEDMIDNRNDTMHDKKDVMHDKNGTYNASSLEISELIICPIM